MSEADLRSFLSHVPLRTLRVGLYQWQFFDYGPRQAPTLVCVGGLSDTAITFFRLTMSLATVGYRVISVGIPQTETHDEFVVQFGALLDALGLASVHILGVSLGGFLAQCYANRAAPRVASLVLVNSFVETSFFEKTRLPRLQPEFLLKRKVLATFPSGEVELAIANSIDFVVTQLETLTGAELAARLMMLSQEAVIVPVSVPVMVVDCLDDVIVPERAREELYKFYPESRYALLKTGGNWPHLSRPDDVHMHVLVHFRALGVEPGDTNGAMVELGVDAPSSASLAAAAALVSASTAPAPVADDDDGFDLQGTVQTAVPVATKPAGGFSAWARYDSVADDRGRAFTAEDAYASARNESPAAKPSAASASFSTTSTFAQADDDDAEE
eukprot:a509005_15.p1 GENE.a509005_15~~a509005_15.p1  ORF type:complete len:398 (+),score=121.06 a509005_15:39-1196(+)